MYSLQWGTTGLTIEYEGGTVIGALVPSLHFHDGSSMQLAPVADADADSGKARTAYVFEDGEKRYTLTLEPCFEHDVLSMKLRIVSRYDVFQKPLCLAPVKGIRLLAGYVPGEGFMANYSYYHWWTRPAFPEEAQKVPALSQSLAWRSGGHYHHLMPMCDGRYSGMLEGTDQGLEIALSAHQLDQPDGEAYAFVMSSGSCAFALPDAVAAEGLRLVGNLGGSRSERLYPKKLEYLGWCTWDAFYHEVNEAGILEKLQEFNDKGVPVQWVMIDDGWSPVKDKMLESFGVDRSKFPRGLRPLIADMKSNYGVREVGVWHAFTGYWNGVHPDNTLSGMAQAALVETLRGQRIPDPSPAVGRMFWYEWHHWLRSQGVSFVKVDSQSSLHYFLRSGAALNEDVKGTHEALEDSVNVHFEGCIINCMGMIAENVWNRPSSAVSRNSDDFYPKKERWFTEHALQNAYNSYYHGAFYWGDWDMFWTVHEDAERHAVLRAVSGGPVYISDAVGATDGSIVEPLIAADGRIARCDQPGLPTEDCLLADPTVNLIPLKLWNTAGGGQYGVIAAFHLHPEAEAVEGAIRVSDVPGLRALASGYAVYECFSGRSFVLGEDDTFLFSLGSGEKALFRLSPIHHGFAVIGLEDKYISPWFVSSVELGEDYAEVSLKQGGPLIFYSERKPVKVEAGGASVEAVELGGGFYLANAAAPHLRCSLQ